MKTSKLLITSLLAAAAMSAPANAELLSNVTYTGGSSVTNQTLGDYTLTDTITMGTTIAQDSPDTNLGSMTAGGNFYPPAYTLSFWVDISALPDSSNITLFTYGGSTPAGNDGANALALNSNGTLTFGQGKTNGTSFAFGSGSGRQVTTTGNALTTGTVYHIALVNNGQGSTNNTATLYINGTAVLTDVAVNLNMAGGNETTVFSNLNLASASNISYGDAMLYSGALSQKSIAKIATHNVYDLTWNGGETGNWNTTDANWTKAGAEGSVAFEDFDNVTFGTSGNVAVTVATGGVTAGAVNITAGTVSFTGGTITALGGVSVTGGTLNLSTNVFAAGTAFNVSGGALALGTTFSVTAGTSINVTDAGTLTGTITAMGAGSSLTLAGTPGASPLTISGAVGGTTKATINISNGNQVTIDKTTDQALFADISISGEGSKFTQGNTNDADLLKYSGATSITISDGGELALGSNRWSFNTNNSLSLDGGNITGSSQTSGTNKYGNLDFFAEKTINVSNSYSKESNISASIRLRADVTFAVAEGATLNITGKIGNATVGKKIIKSGTGKMTLDIASTAGELTEDFTGGLDVNGGEVEVRHASALGTGAVTVNGTGSVLDFAVSGGTFTQGASQALTTTDGGKITVSAGALALTGAVNLSSAIEVASGASVTTTNAVSFALAGLTGTENGNGSTTFTLFTLADGASLTWNSLTAANINLAGTTIAERGATATFDNAAGTVTVVSGTAGDLVWNGASGSSTWNYSATNKNWKIGDVVTSFQRWDNVTFGANEAEKTVTLENGADIRVGNMTVEGGDYTLNAGAGNSATISGETLTVASGASLQLSSELPAGQASALRLGFDNISVAGTLKVYTNSTDTWSKLTFADSGSGILHLYDIGGDENTTGLAISTLQMSGNGAFTGTYNGKVDVGVLTGSGDLTLNSPTDALYNAFTLAVGDMTSYTGTVSLVKGAYGTLTLNVDSTKIGSDARVVVGAGTTLKMNILEAANTSGNDYSKISGTGTLSLGLRNDNGVGFDLRNFEGTIRVERGTGVTAASRFQLNTSTLNENASIVVANGNDLVFNDNTNKNVSNSVTFEGSGTIHVNSGCFGTLSGNVTSAGTLAKAGSGALTLSGTSNINTLTVSDGTLNISGSSTEIGTLNLNGGKLKVTNGAVLDLTNNSARAGTSVGSSATLEIDGVGSTVKISNGAWNAESSLGMTYTNTQVALSNGGVFEVTQAQSAEDSAQGAAKRGFSISGGEGTYRYSGTGTSYIADNSSAANNQHIGLADGATLIFAVTQDAATLEVSKVIAATAAGATTATTGALKKTGVGTLTLNGANLYSGGTTIEGGVLVAGSETALGTTKGVEVKSGATLNLGTSAVTVAGLSGAGAVGLADGTTSSTLTVNSATDSTFSGTLSGDMSVVKTGAGTQEFSGSFALFGDSDNAKSVSVQEGTLKLHLDTGNTPLVGSISVSSGSSLGVVAASDSFFGVAATTDGGSTYDGRISFDAGGKLVVDLDSVDVVDGATQVALKILSSSAISFAGIDVASMTLTDATLGGFVEFIDTNGVFTEFEKSWVYAQDDTFNISTLSLTMTIPEPSVFGLLAGAGALALAAARRRRRRA